jgi:hypothetical protein
MAVREWLRFQKPDFYMYGVFITLAEMGGRIPRCARGLYGHADTD